MQVTGGHALGEEAAALVRQAVSLAARRGHAQVTPLHIASAMLLAPAPAGVLRAACARSQTHPMQHDTLDLCLDLELARLAVAVAQHGGDPEPSNAFVAALKRAQAHRRSRGEGKVELDKLVISVLDDPSVDRAMRATGFSSSQVRASVEKAVASSEQSSRAGCDVAASSPNPVPHKIRAGGGKPSLHTVPDGSYECQASKAKSGAGRPAIFCGVELGTTTASIPPWLRRYKDTTCIRSTYCGTSLQAACCRPTFTELTATNLKILCNVLELHIPRHGNIVPGISSTVLRCRSGVMRRRPSSSSSSTPSTWLLFLGRDGGGKMKVAQELARLVFGSYAEFTALRVQGNPDIPARSGKLALKRQRASDNDGDLGARLFEALVQNPHHVILIDGADRLDRDSKMHIKNAIAGGTMMGGCNGDAVGLEDAIVVLSVSDVLDSRYVPGKAVCVASSSSPRVKRWFSGQNREERDAAELEVRSRRLHSWDLNVYAVDEEEEEEDSLADDEGILNIVDGAFLFN